MAHKSGGEVPTKHPIVDANQAIALLSTMHHWAATKVNNEGKVTYKVTVTHAGKRVTAQRRSFVLATLGAMAKLRDDVEPVLRLAQ